MQSLIWGDVYELSKFVKRLDNLCKDIFQGEAGITTYLKTMEEIRYNIPHRADFDADYEKLHHYRHLRNLIAHDNYADESNMCSAEDAAWLEQFYGRILAQTDPVLQYHKAKAASRRQTARPKREEPPVEYQTEKEPNFSISPTVLTVLLVVSAIVLLWFIFAMVLK